MRWAERLRHADALAAECSARTDAVARHGERLQQLFRQPGLNIGAGLVIGYAGARGSPRRALALVRLGRRWLRLLMPVNPGQ